MPYNNTWMFLNITYIEIVKTWWYLHQNVIFLFTQDSPESDAEREKDKKEKDRESEKDRTRQRSESKHKSPKKKTGKDSVSIQNYFTPVFSKYKNEYCGLYDNE